MSAIRDGEAVDGLVEEGLSQWVNEGGVFKLKISSMSKLRHVLFFNVKNPEFVQASPAISISGKP